MTRIYKYNLVVADHDTLPVNSLLTDKELKEINSELPPARRLKTTKVNVYAESCYFFFGVRFGEVRRFIQHAYFCDSAFSALYLEIANSGDAARVMYEYAKSSEETIKKVGRWQQIKYTKKGEPYIVYMGRKYGLDNFLRIDRPTAINY